MSVSLNATKPRLCTVRDVFVAAEGGKSTRLGNDIHLIQIDVWHNHRTNEQKILRVLCKKNVQDTNKRTVFLLNLTGFFVCVYIYIYAYKTKSTLK